MLCKTHLPRSFAAAAALSLSMAGAAAADTVVVTADRMIDVIAGRVVEHPQIVITDGRISSVGTQDTAVLAGARRVDLPGMTLLPGLIDMHTHITSDPRYGGYRELEFTDNFWTVVGVASAKKTLEAGFTTIRNVGSANFDDVAIKQGIEQGIIPGPRIVPATYAIGATGGHCDADEFPPSVSVPSPQVANGPDELRAAVRKMRAAGGKLASGLPAWAVAGCAGAAAAALVSTGNRRAEDNIAQRC